MNVEWVALDGERRSPTEGHRALGRRRVRHVEAAWETVYNGKLIVGDGRSADRLHERRERSVVVRIADFSNPYVVGAAVRDEIKRFGEPVREVHAGVPRLPLRWTPRVQRDVTVATATKRPVP